MCLLFVRNMTRTSNFKKRPYSYVLIYLQSNPPKRPQFAANIVERVEYRQLLASIRLVRRDERSSKYLRADVWSEHRVPSHCWFSRGLALHLSKLHKILRWHRSSWETNPGLLHDRQWFRLHTMAGDYIYTSSGYFMGNVWSERWVLHMLLIF